MSLHNVLVTTTTKDPSLHHGIVAGRPFDPLLKSSECAFLSHPIGGILICSLHAPGPLLTGRLMNTDLCVTLVGSDAHVALSHKCTRHHFRRELHRRFFLLDLRQDIRFLVELSRLSGNLKIFPCARCHEQGRCRQALSRVRDRFLEVPLLLQKQELQSSLVFFQRILLLSQERGCFVRDLFLLLLEGPDDGVCECVTLINWTPCLWHMVSTRCILERDLFPRVCIMETHVGL
mmetsp:Transcript_23054/g.60652  ORF Transcript_23054/g.60652 Transcript_23054/m.60652 type:complete len:233 (+) Transcript_23054:166-864(+)